MIDQGVTAALAARDANRNGDDSHTSGTGVRRTKRVARECSYQYFMKCQLIISKATEGVVDLINGYLKGMEAYVCISHCFVVNQIKFSTCTLLAGALTWWNSYVWIVGHDVAYGTNQRFQNCIAVCVRMFPEESDKLSWLGRWVASNMIHRKCYVGRQNKNHCRSYKWQRVAETKDLARLLTSSENQRKIG
ncbi:hypothetical protein Tco_0140685 [Tanacetum coccineum]